MASDFLLVLWHQVEAVIWNVVDWLVVFICRFLPSALVAGPDAPRSGPRCVSIDRPGGLHRLRVQTLPDDTMTVGHGTGWPGVQPPFVRVDSDVSLPADAVQVAISNFSVNFADVTIRWGLYESALRFIGYPIVPGFDISGTVERAGPQSGFKAGDRVFGCSLFGSYSSRALIPARQLRRCPAGLDSATAAAVPAVAFTALHALSLAGCWPNAPVGNRAVLIHSAAGGVGSMLVQMAKLLGLGPIVAIVGSPTKLDTCLTLGADVVIDKSSEALWPAVEAAAPGGFAAVFDANGVTTLSDSYAHLAQNGRLVTYGFHGNLPRGAELLSPWKWIEMAKGIVMMPRFDAMQLVLESRAVMGFNLSFFAEQHELIGAYFDQVVEWLAADKLRVARVKEFAMNDIGAAHGLIQSGASVGKIVLNTADAKSKDA